MLNILNLCANSLPENVVPAAYQESSSQPDIYTDYQEIETLRQSPQQQHQNEGQNAYTTFMAQQPNWEQDLCSYWRSLQREVLKPILQEDKGQIWMVVESIVTPHS